MFSKKEWLHWKVRRELWGYAKDEQLDAAALSREEYRGIRPAPGYPACPDHSLKPTLFELLNAGENAGLILTESYAMLPTAAVSGLASSVSASVSASDFLGSGFVSGSSISGSSFSITGAYGPRTSMMWAMVSRT